MGSFQKYVTTANKRRFVFLAVALMALGLVSRTDEDPQKAELLKRLQLPLPDVSTETLHSMAYQLQANPPEIRYSIARTPILRVNPRLNHPIRPCGYARTAVWSSSAHPMNLSGST